MPRKPRRACAGILKSIPWSFDMLFPSNAPDLIIFDCDGVLVDTERVNNQVMAELVAEYGLLLRFPLK